MPTVLVVDDEPDIRDILQLTLENSGFRVLTARDGAEALAAIEEAVPDAMLLDIGMPNVDGWQVLERIKSSAEVDLARVPVIMVTAWTSEDDRLRGGVEGAVRYLAKPFDPREVVEVLEELLAPGAPPEPEVRRKVQQSSLERLARRERGDETEPATGEPRVHLTRLDHRAAPPVSSEEGLTSNTLPAFLSALTARQREVVEAVIEGVPVSDLAAHLDVSRSNVYAVLRRVAKKAGLPDGRSLIHRLRRIGPLHDG